MPLHPFLQALVDKANGLPPMSSVPVDKIRAGDLRRCSTGLPLEPIESSEDLLIPGPRGQLRIRVYRPHLDACTSSHPLPLTVFFHGSGFVICSIETHDEMCRHLCQRSGSLVISVDYALAPEHPFPAAPNDCLASVQWVAANAASLGGDPARIALAGDSAGGNLATVTAARLRDESPKIKLRAQLLLYPVTDHYSAGHPSYEERDKHCGLTRDDMVWFWHQYLRDPTLAAHPQVSPLRAVNLAGLPPTFIATAEYDVLRDEGRAYGARLQAAGVPTKIRHCADANHGFMFWVGLVNNASAAMNEAGAWLRDQLK